MLDYLLAVSLQLNDPPPAIIAIASPIIYQMGNAGESIRILQEDLHKLNYYQGRIDGIYNAEMVRVIQKFQKDNGLDITGKIDRQTLDTLRIKVTSVLYPQSPYIVVIPTNPDEDDRLLNYLYYNSYPYAYVKDSNLGLAIYVGRYATRNRADSVVSQFRDMGYDARVIYE